MKEMIIVMGNGMVRKTGDPSDRMLFPRIVVEDLIPYIESRYNVLKDKWNRAMAGLSMGSFQTSITTLTHPDLFGYAGLFSGFMRAPWPSDDAQAHMALAEKKDAFNQAFKVFYRAMGTEDQYFNAFEADDAWLEGRGLNITREIFPGGHDWTVWRRCIRSFLPRLFCPDSTNGQPSLPVFRCLFSDPAGHMETRSDMMEPETDAEYRRESE